MLLHVRACMRVCVRARMHSFVCASMRVRANPYVGVHRFPSLPPGEEDVQGYDLSRLQKPLDTDADSLTKPPFSDGLPTHLTPTHSTCCTSSNHNTCCSYIWFYCLQIYNCIEIH